MPPFSSGGPSGSPYSLELAVSLAVHYSACSSQNIEEQEEMGRKGRGGQSGTYKLLDGQGAFSASHPALTRPLPISR